ncbi:MAG: hypothetical protein QM734_08835 [Cyclobacteriaceae bacterium]
MNTLTSTFETEEIAIRKSQEDPKEFGVLYEKYFKKIFLFVLHRTGEKEVATDLTQEYLLRLFRGLKNLNFEGFRFHLGYIESPLTNATNSTGNKKRHV